MITWFAEFHPVVQALLAGLFTWGVTALGASIVFVTKSFNPRILDSMLGFAAGVMIAASFWSLLAPAIEMAEEHNPMPVWFPAAAGFIGGAAVLRLIDNILPHLHPGYPRKKAEGIATSWHRSVLFVVMMVMDVALG